MALLWSNGFVPTTHFYVLVLMQKEEFFFHNHFLLCRFCTHLEVLTVKSAQPHLPIWNSNLAILFPVYCMCVPRFCAHVCLCFCVCWGVRMSSHCWCPLCSVWQSSAKPASILAQATARENSRIEPPPSAAVRLSEKCGPRNLQKAPKTLVGCTTVAPWPPLHKHRYIWTHCYRGAKQTTKNSCGQICPPALYV